MVHIYVSVLYRVIFTNLRIAVNYIEKKIERHHHSIVHTVLNQDVHQNPKRFMRIGEHSNTMIPIPAYIPMRIKIATGTDTSFGFGFVLLIPLVIHIPRVFDHCLDRTRQVTIILTPVRNRMNEMYMY